MTLYALFNHPLRSWALALRHMGNILEVSRINGLSCLLTHLIHIILGLLLARQGLFELHLLLQHLLLIRQNRMFAEACLVAG